MRKDCKSFVESDTNSDLRLLLIASIARVVVVNKISVRETLSSSGGSRKSELIKYCPCSVGSCRVHMQLLRATSSASSSSGI
jgi:hypothetical protein